MSLRQTLEVLNAIAQVPSTTKKKELIQRSLLIPGFRNTVVYAYHPLLTFNIRFVPGNHVGSDREVDHKEIFGALKNLSTKRGATLDDRNHLDSLITDNPTLEVVTRILNKDLACGAGAKIFGEFIPLPDFEPMLCQSDIEALWRKVGQNSSKLCWSIKLDGVRTRAGMQTPQSTPKYLSRNGKEYQGFSVFDKAVQEICRAIAVPGDDSWYPMTLDGEVISYDKDFQRQMTQIHRLENADPSIFRFSIFDVILPPPHNKKPLMERLQILQTALLPKKYEIVEWLPHHMFRSGIDLVDIASLADRIADSGEEGIIVKALTSLYTSGRSWEWTKIKKFETDDLKVVGKEEGKDKLAGTLGALIVSHPYEGGMVEVKVGSGYTDEERAEFWANPPSIIEVKYQQETKDGSLRFPTFVRVRDDKDEVTT